MHFDEITFVRMMSKIMLMLTANGLPTTNNNQKIVIVL
jgi:hypothetical protein